MVYEIGEKYNKIFIFIAVAIKNAYKTFEMLPSSFYKKIYCLFIFSHFLFFIV